MLLFTGRWVYNWGAYRVGRGGSGLNAAVYGIP